MFGWSHEVLCLDRANTDPLLLRGVTGNQIFRLQQHEKIYCRTGDDLCYRPAGSTQGASRSLLPFRFANTGPTSGLLRTGLLPRRLLLWPLWVRLLPSTLLAPSVLVSRTLVLRLRNCHRDHCLLGRNYNGVFGLESTKDVDAIKKANDLSKRRLIKSAHRTSELTTR
jgi:hypothetical protein